jgi:hypothetical protein
VYSCVPFGALWAQKWHKFQVQSNSSFQSIGTILIVDISDVWLETYQAGIGATTERTFWFRFNLSQISLAANNTESLDYHHLSELESDIGFRTPDTFGAFFGGY